MIKVMVTGASGMLGATLCDFLKINYDVYPVIGNNFSNNNFKKYLPFDFSSDNFRILKRWCNPDVIIHCAAITNVDYCETHKKEAMLVNGESVKKLIEVFPKAKLIYISSDAVYEPNSNFSSETDKVNPQTVYGKSKQLGEKYVIQSKNNTAIRTTLVGININKNKQSFAEWIINSLIKNIQINLYDDVFFTPVSIWSFSTCIEWVLNNKTPNILNIAGKERISKYDFGILLADKLDLPKNLIKRSKLHNFNSGTKRSKNMTIDSSLFESISDIPLPNNSKTINELSINFKGLR